MIRPQRRTIPHKFIPGPNLLARSALGRSVVVPRRPVVSSHAILGAASLRVQQRRVPTLTSFPILSVIQKP